MEVAAVATGAATAAAEEVEKSAVQRSWEQRAGGGAEKRLPTLTLPILGTGNPEKSRG